MNRIKTKQKNTFLHHLDLNDLVYRKPDLHALDRINTLSDDTRFNNVRWGEQLFIKNQDVEPIIFDEFYNAYAPYLRLERADVMAEMEITVWETALWNYKYGNKTTDL